LTVPRTGRGVGWRFASVGRRGALKMLYVFGLFVFIFVVLMALEGDD
jgi:hypothetical protein